MMSVNSNEEFEESSESVTVQEIHSQTSEPPHFAVLLHNDDYTTMEFVVEILKGLFHKSEEQALQIMLKIHHEGKGVAGIYHYEIAETKVAQVHQRAQSRGFPLKCSLEPA